MTPEVFKHPRRMGHRTRRVSAENALRYFAGYFITEKKSSARTSMGMFGSKCHGYMEDRGWLWQQMYILCKRWHGNISTPPSRQRECHTRGFVSAVHADCNAVTIQGFLFASLCVEMCKQSPKRHLKRQRLTEGTVHIKSLRLHVEYYVHADMPA